MKMFEYMGKELFAKYGLPVPPGKMVTNPEEAASTAAEIGKPVVIKSQVLTGKRGKAGGIKFADTPEQAAAAAKELLGMDIQGLTVETLLVEEKLKRISEVQVEGLNLNRAFFIIKLTQSIGGFVTEEFCKYLNDPEASERFLPK
jgi:succinyl-CoA synthetase beta subunit